MSEIKMVEIRDRATFIPAMAIRLMADKSTEPADHYLLERAGFYGDAISPEYIDKPGYVILVQLESMDANYDSFAWGPSRTMCEAHQFILENWSKIASGDVIDIEFILSEKPQPKKSERLEDR